MRKHALKLAFAVSLAGALPAQAGDLGVQGQIWPIVEIDFRQLMLQSAARADLTAAQQEVQSSADRFFDELPRRNLPSIEKTETHYIDPSITLNSDIMAPLPDSKGEYQWSRLYPKGTRVNPLSTYRPITAMLFFDGNSEEQLAFVKEALAANPMRIVPVETAGANVKKLSERFSRPIYFANEAMMARFKVLNLPSLLYPGSGEYALYLGMTAFARPYKLAELEGVWPSKLPVAGSAAAGNGPANPPAVTEAEKKAVGTLLNINPKEPSNAKDH